MEGGMEMVATLMLAAVLGADVPRVQIVVFSQSWCGPCVAAERDFKPWLERSGWKVGTEATAHIRTVDCDCETEMADEFGIESYPTFVILRDATEVRRYVGYRGRRQLVEDYMREWNR